MAKGKMTSKQFEHSAQDKKMDRAGAKKAGVSQDKWEGSKADRTADRAALNKINQRRGK